MARGCAAKPYFSSVSPFAMNSRKEGGPQGKRRRRSAERTGDARPRATAPPADPARSETPAAPRLDGPPGVVLERLRDRIHDVVRELDALRAENVRLGTQIAALRAAADGTGGDAVLRVEDDPQAVREKIQGFIAALDQYLDGSDAA